MLQVHSILRASIEWYWSGWFIWLYQIDFEKITFQSVIIFWLQLTCIKVDATAPLSFRAKQFIRLHLLQKSKMCGSSLFLRIPWISLVQATAVTNIDWQISTICQSYCASIDTKSCRGQWQFIMTILPFQWNFWKLSLIFARSYCASIDTKSCRGSFPAERNSQIHISHFKLYSYCNHWATFQDGPFLRDWFKKTRSSPPLSNEKFNTKVELWNIFMLIHKKTGSIQKFPFQQELHRRSRNSHLMQMFDPLKFLRRQISQNCSSSSSSSECVNFIEFPRIKASQLLFSWRKGHLETYLQDNQRRQLIS